MGSVFTPLAIRPDLTHHGLIGVEPANPKTKRPEIEGFQPLTLFRDAPRCTSLSRSHHKIHYTRQFRLQSALNMRLMTVRGERRDA
jgi:hypothetical protein